MNQLTTVAGQIEATDEFFDGRASNETLCYEEAA